MLLEGFKSAVPLTNSVSSSVSACVFTFSKGKQYLLLHQVAFSDIIHVRA